MAHVVWAALGDVAHYVEPFFGSGAVMLNRPHSPNCETINDADGLLANFWRAIQHDPAEVARHADNPVNECVPAGTMIATPLGNIAVENIRPCMTVWGEREGKLVPSLVTATRESPTCTNTSQV